MYVIKHLPEDFIVEEVSKVKIGKEGKFSYFEVWKKDLTTGEAIKRIARALNVPTKNISYSGNKDRRAITTQTCSVKNIGKEKLESLELEDIKIKYLGKGNEPAHLGELEGNNFKIVVRNIDEKPEIKTKILNLFGEQRFSRTNAEVGEHIIKRKFKEAAELIMEGTEAFKKLMQDFFDKKEYITAIKRVPRRTLMLFVHAYQSKIWNRMVEESQEEVVPIIGFGTEMNEKIEEQLRKEGLTKQSFIVREIPELSVEGGERKVFVEAENLKIELGEDEEFEGKKKIKLEFFLPKGSYATEFIRQNFQ